MSEHNGHDLQQGIGGQEAPKRGAPIFEVVVYPTIAVLNRTPLHHFKVWPDGYTEGFEGLGGAAVVTNRVPLLLHSIAGPISQVANTLMEAIQHLSKGSVMKHSGDAATPASNDPAAQPGK